MISEPLIYSVIKLKLDTQLIQLHSYKATNSSTEENECRNIIIIIIIIIIKHKYGGGI